MKNKELEAKVNEVIDTLKGLMSEVTFHEHANDSLTLEMNNLKSRNIVLTQEVEALRREHIEDQATIEKYQALKPKQKPAPADEPLPRDVYFRLTDTTRATIDAIRKAYGLQEVNIKDRAVKAIVLDCRNSMSSFTTTLRILANRTIRGNKPAVVLTFGPYGEITKLLKFKFNF